LLYGAVSPENLNWNFNLAGSLGVSQTPVSASLAPSYGVKSSYKVYEMMKIQGSLRTLRSWLGREYDVEDGEMIWTLEENSLQKSGLPREFTFVMLITKGDSDKVILDVDIEPRVATWFGHYPQLWTNLVAFRPLHKEPIDLDKNIGQKFEPSVAGRGFNFAGLMGTFDDFVSLPGTTYSTSDAAVSAVKGKAGDKAKQGQTPAKDAPSADTLNVRVFLEGFHGGSPSPTPSQHKTYTISSSQPPQKVLHPTHSRSGIKEHGAGHESGQRKPADTSTGSRSRTRSTLPAHAPHGE